ncbi:hypothetical protein Taro_018275 [Colocasia esculenta]|uniref:4-coumarate--CoA ligase n=1 Tax=Colocasia esculenta TaxID=4460 RepID=A0A843UTE8_COLES|nr:hypothetical protein [Colocasia esculenta]
MLLLPFARGRLRLFVFLPAAAALLHIAPAVDDPRLSPHHSGCSSVTETLTPPVALLHDGEGLQEVVLEVTSSRRCRGDHCVSLDLKERSLLKFAYAFDRDQKQVSSSDLAPMEGAASAGSSSSPPPSSIDPRSGFCAATRTFNSLRPPVPLPPPSEPLSVTSYLFSALLSSFPRQGTAFINATRGGESLSYAELLCQVPALAFSLRSRLGLAKGDVAFVLAPPGLEIPILYFALLSIGVVVSPSNPAFTPQEISHQFQLTNPSVAFATSAEAHKLPRGVNTVLLDAPLFRSLLADGGSVGAGPAEEVRQSDPAAVLYSSGTTGRVKAVVLSHRNFIAMTANYKETYEARETTRVALITVPLFHVFGLTMLLRLTALGHSSVLMEWFDFAGMLRAVERYRVTGIPVWPPLIVAMVKSDLVGKHDLSSLEVVGCGGAPLGREVAERFAVRFPHIEIVQASHPAGVGWRGEGWKRKNSSFHPFLNFPCFVLGYGLTESTGGASSTIGPEETQAYGSVGRLAPNMEGKIVDPGTGQSLSLGQQGELWLRGPTIMQGERVGKNFCVWWWRVIDDGFHIYLDVLVIKGYLGDPEATASTLDSEGWLKTGDLCYFNEDGFLFIVDRLKELIKYKGYQVPPAELEHILLSHPEIADAAVVPYPDEDVGQIPMAFVVKRPGSSLSGDQVIQFVAKHVAPYKKIRRVSFIELIPKSATGKILRRELMNHAISGSASKS